MILDRAKQLAMLERLAAIYPKHTVHIVDGEPTEDDLANLWYLKEQGLVDGPLVMSISETFIFQGIRITAKGQDFLADDGGISAILSTVTVRIHADSIRALMLAKIDSSSAPPEKKAWLRKQFESASSETLKKITNALVDEGIKHVPNLVSWAEQLFKNGT